MKFCFRAEHRIGTIGRRGAPYNKSTISYRNACCAVQASCDAQILEETPVQENSRHQSLAERCRCLASRSMACFASVSVAGDAVFPVDLHVQHDST
jgi:hypothetical protein